MSFDKLFDIVRLVDPLKKEVVKYQNGSKDKNYPTCHDYWKKGSQCENCIFIRALKENDSFVKIEYNKDKIYFVMSCPANISGQQYVL